MQFKVKSYNNKRTRNVELLVSKIFDILDDSFQYILLPVRTDCEQLNLLL